MTIATTAASGGAARLRAKIDLVLGEAQDAGLRLVRHPRVRDLYPEYLVASHGIVRASVPLMEAARERAASLTGEDPVAAGLAAYLEEHIPEELDHDEWVLQDLELLGVDRARVLARPPTPTIAQFVGAQYYWVAHYHPVALLGYIALLEGYPPMPGLVDELMAATGYERAAFRTLDAHATLDQGHREELDAAIDALPLTAAQEDVLGLSALSSVAMMARVVDEVVSRAPA
jgi:hypothetical protein